MPDAPMHPGQLLALDVVPALRAAGVTKAQLAVHLGMSRQNLDNILAGASPITPATAVRLAALFGGARADAWLRAQWAWDVARARAELGPAVDQLPDLSGIRWAA